MTRLQEYVASFVQIPGKRGEELEKEVLNRLTAAGVVSDNCDKLENVATADQQKAVGWIAKNIG